MKFIVSGENTGSPRNFCFVGYSFFDHSLSHRHARSTRKQWRKKSRKGCVWERKGAEMPKIEREQVLPNSLGAGCREFESLHSKKIPRSIGNTAGVFYSCDKISAALVSGFTLGIIFSILPFSSIIKVVRTTPIEVFPHIFFSCHTP